MKTVTLTLTSRAKKIKTCNSNSNNNNNRNHRKDGTGAQTIQKAGWSTLQQRRDYPVTLDIPATLNARQNPSTLTAMLTIGPRTPHNPAET